VKKPTKFGALASGLLVAMTASSANALGTWSTLVSQFLESVSPNGPQQPILLFDGTVLVPAYSENMHWYQLTPDSNGTYQNGTWSWVTASHVWRSASASQILSDGSVWVFGGENATPNTNQDANPNQGEIYNPVAGTWTVIPSDPYGPVNLGDDASVFLPDGNVLTAVARSRRTRVVRSGTPRASTNIHRRPTVGSQDSPPARPPPR
jgi:hypothetical protein